MSKIYEPRGRAREYSPFALNCFKGCDHGCQYCYVPRMMKVFSGSYVHENVSCVNLSGLRKEAARFRASKDGDKQVLLSFTGTPIVRQSRAKLGGFFRRCWITISMFRF